MAGKKKPVCKVTGQDGNAFVVIGLIRRCLKKAGLKAEAEEFSKQAQKCVSYNHLLLVCCDYVKLK